MRRASYAALVAGLLAGCAERPPLPDGWSIVVLPDTQYYASDYPETFAAQTRWIGEQVVALDVQFVLHVGDVTDDNGHSQWQVAREAFDAIEGEVPYVLTTGNHDYGEGGNASHRETLLHEYFPVAEAMARPGFGGLFEPERLDNSWHLFETPSGPWLVLALEFGPRDEVVAWADEVLSAHPGVPSILLTHAYLHHANGESARYDVTGEVEQPYSPHTYGIADLPGGVNDGEALYQKLVRRHDQIDFVFSGHVIPDGVGRLTSVQDGGGIVHELLSDYQSFEMGGQGYLRVLTFTEGEVSVRTYSPVLDGELEDPGNRFTLPWP